jgi:MFS superfamily sulfate permease-like transporter
MTGVIVRSSANVAAGARTRASAIIHGIWLLVFISALPFVLELVPIASLAAVLVYTGYKLAYPKALRELLNYGKSEVVIYLVMIGMIVYSNLLEGVLVGLGLSVLKLLYAFSHLEIHSEDDPGENRVNLHLKGAATLIRLPKLAAALEQVRPNADVHVRFEELDYIDHACLDLLHNWERQHEALGGSMVIEWEALSECYHRRHASKQARREAKRSWSHRPSRKVAVITERALAIG